MPINADLKWIIQNWKTILGLLTFIATALGWYQDNTAKANELSMKDRQVAAIAEAYYPAVKETLTVKERTTIIRSDCNQCDRLESRLDKHEERHKAGFVY